MEVLTLTLFASVVLAFSAVLFFVWNVKRRSHEHTEHLALLPLDDEASVPARSAGAATTSGVAQPPAQPRRA